MTRMKALIGALLIFIFVTPGRASAQDEAVSNPYQKMDLEWEIGAWTDIWDIEKFDSKAVGGSVSFYIYLPPDYDQSTMRYPVVYWMHGAFGQPSSATPIAKRLDTALRKGEARELIIVSCFDPTGLSMWTDSKDGRLPMEQVLVDELIPHIDANYRTISNRSGRGVEGFSMGGYGAAFLGLKYNELFSSVSILAGALHTPETLRERRPAIFENVFSADLEYAAAQSPWTVLDKNADKARGRTSFRVFVGADDLLLEWNRDYHAKLKDLGIEHDWGVVPNSPHNLATVMENWEGDFFDFYQRAFYAK